MPANSLFVVLCAKSSHIQNGLCVMNMLYVYFELGIISKRGAFGNIWLLQG